LAKHVDVGYNSRPFFVTADKQVYTWVFTNKGENIKNLNLYPGTWTPTGPINISPKPKPVGPVIPPPKVVTVSSIVFTMFPEKAKTISNEKMLLEKKYAVNAGKVDTDMTVNFPSIAV